MEQLQLSIAERFNRVHEILENPGDMEQFYLFKKEEKDRCDKENAVLSGIKISSTNHNPRKYIYFESSLKIMQIIAPKFVYKWQVARLQLNFLNQLVGLFQTFFSQFQEQLNFKVKLNNLIRPTNHNLVHNLIRYLVDFSRDYYQQAYFWQKKLQNNPNTQEVMTKIPKFHTHRDIIDQKFIQSDLISSKILFKKSSNNFEQISNKIQIYKFYTYLDIISLPLVPILDRSMKNLDSVRIRMNQMYRENKNRNIALKMNILSYYEQYHQTKLIRKQYCSQEIVSFFKLPLSLRISLNIDKNGFTTISMKQKSLKKLNRMTYNHLEPLKISQRITAYQETQRQNKSEFMLTSLKILRVSQNFLPPIEAIKTNCIDNQSKLNISQKINSFGAQHSIKQKSRDKERTDNLKLINEQSVPRRLKKRKNFSSQQQKKKPLKNKDDPQKRIISWLSKIQCMKSAEKKKIMGLK